MEHPLDIRDEPHKDNQSLSVPSTSSNTKEFIKDPYILEFLDLPENIEGKALWNLLKYSINGFLGVRLG